MDDLSRPKPPGTGAHFGREIWQVNFAALILAASDNPQLLLEYDMVGNRLDQPVDVGSAVSFDREKWLHTKERWERGDLQRIKPPSLARVAAKYLQGLRDRV